MLDLETGEVILSRQWKTKAVISLHGCKADLLYWSHLQNTGFSYDAAHIER